MASEDNLSPQQFNEPQLESDKLNLPYNKKLKSPWVPKPDAGDGKWARRQLSYSDLEWHMDNHHMKMQTKDPTGTLWTPAPMPDRGDMTPEQYHDHLHTIGHFRYNKEHKHFTPKDKR